MTTVAAIAIVLCIALAYRVEVLLRRLRESGEANCVLYETVSSLREQLAQADTFEWEERLLLTAVKAEFIAHQKWMRSGPNGSMREWTSAKSEMDTRCGKLLVARGEMPSPAQMRAEIRASLPPGERPAIRCDDLTPVYGLVVSK